MKSKWLARRIARHGPYLALCLTEKDFLAKAKHLGTRNVPPWVPATADASTHFFENSKYDTAAIVCIAPRSERTPIEIAGLIVHEAVHVWQQYCIDIGERCPGSEQEAYAIQAISQELMADYVRQTQA